MVANSSIPMLIGSKVILRGNYQNQVITEGGHDGISQTGKLGAQGL